MQLYFIREDTEKLESKNALLMKNSAILERKAQKLKQGEDKLIIEKKALKEKRELLIEREERHQNNLAILAIETEMLEKDIASQKSEIDKNDEHINLQKKKTNTLNKIMTQLSDAINDKRVITESLQDEQYSLERENKSING